MHDVPEPIRQRFPKVSMASEFFNQLNQLLKGQYGFVPGNTRFAEGTCCDEINEPELQRLEQYWGERFKFGGLAGYCHGGRTGLGAVTHHVPVEPPAAPRQTTNLPPMSARHSAYVLS